MTGHARMRRRFSEAIYTIISSRERETGGSVSAKSDIAVLPRSIVLGGFLAFVVWRCV